MTEKMNTFSKAEDSIQNNEVSTREYTKAKTKTKHPREDTLSERLTNNLYPKKDMNSRVNQYNKVFFGGKNKGFAKLLMIFVLILSKTALLTFHIIFLVVHGLLGVIGSLFRKK